MTSRESTPALSQALMAPRPLKDSQGPPVGLEGHHGGTLATYLARTGGGSGSADSPNADDTAKSVPQIVLWRKGQRGAFIFKFVI